MEFDKKTTMLELTFKASGTVNVNCDLTNEPFDLPIKNDFFLRNHQKQATIFCYISYFNKKIHSILFNSHFIKTN